MHRLSLSGLSGLIAFSLVVGLTACNTGTQQQMTTPAAGETAEPSAGDATAVADLTELALTAREFSIAVAEKEGTDWSFKSLKFQRCIVTSTSPSNITTLAASPWTALNDPGKQGTSHMTIYTAPSGAMVFATGSIQWAWGLDDFNAPGLRTSRLNVAAQRVTANVLQRFLNKPYITNPSTR